MAIDITKGIETFDDRMDTSRSNPDRKKFGQGQGADQFNIGSEYDVAQPEPEPEKKPDAAPAPKFSHKMANGQTLEAETIEELASKIEKALVQAPAAPEEFEEKPLYVPFEFKPKELTLAEQAEILNLMKENPQKAYRLLQEAEFGAPMDTVREKIAQPQQLLLTRLQEEAGAEFTGECEDYNPTRSNAKKLTEFLKEKGKPITAKNLTIAFRQLVAAGDKSLVRKADEATIVEDEGVVDQPPPPSHVPTNQGRPEVAAQGSVDATKFAAMSLNQQKDFFAKLRRG